MTTPHLNTPTSTGFFADASVLDAASLRRRGVVSWVVVAADDGIGNAGNPTQMRLQGASANGLFASAP